MYFCTGFEKSGFLRTVYEVSLSNACTLLNNHWYETALASLQVYCQQLNYTGVKKCVLKSTLSDVLHSASHAKEASACSYIAYIEDRPSCLPGCISWHYECHCTSKCSPLLKCPGLMLWFVLSPYAWLIFIFCSSCPMAGAVLSGSDYVVTWLFLFPEYMRQVDHRCLMKYVWL